MQKTPENFKQTMGVSWGCVGFMGCEVFLGEGRKEQIHLLGFSVWSLVFSVQGFGTKARATTYCDWGLCRCYSRDPSINFQVIASVVMNCVCVCKGQLCFKETVPCTTGLG